MKSQKPLVKRIIIPYFPAGLKMITPLLMAGAVYLVVTDHYIWAAVMVVLSVVILSTCYVTEIDFTGKRYSDYLFLLGLKLGAESAKFTQPEKIVVTKGDHAQTLNTRIQSRQMTWSDYSGTLIFREGGKLDLYTHTSKKKLIIRLKEFAQLFQVDIEDRSTAYPRWID